MDSSYLTTQVSTIISQLHGLFDEIGVPSHEREKREAEVCDTCHGPHMSADEKRSSTVLYQKHYIISCAWSQRKL